LILFPLFLHAQGIPANPPVPGSLGVNIHFTDPTPGEVNEIAEGGFRWVRMDLNWAGTETEKGRYDFSAYDRLMAALEPFHIRPIFILDYTNKFYDGGLSPYDQQGREAFANWVAAAVAHFQGRGVVWEMYNEPNWSFWRPKPNVQLYAELALKVGETFEENYPAESYIGPAGAVIDLPFLKACFAAGLLNYWAAVSIHPYRQRIPESVSAPYAALRKLIAAYAPGGKPVPIIAGEWGYPSTPNWFDMNEEKQARMLAREYLINIAEGIPVTIWYDWRDGNDASKSSDDHYGVVRASYHRGGDPVYAPKPAYFAAQTIYCVLDGYRFSERLANGGPENYVLVFRNGKNVRLAAWTTAKEGDAVTLHGARGKFRVVGLQGAREHGLHAHRHTLTIRLSDSPLYIIPRKAGGLAGIND
ncbi:MAG: hypothetical protein KGM47_16515, partial [Acidobacteriota bacterium]|nr:hypothetical protein [Acidobacteriota bacterium]